jgi:hypothetical protein
MDGLAGHVDFGIAAEGCPGVGVPVEAREVAARDLDPDAVAGQEDVAGGQQIDAQLSRLTGVSSSGASNPLRYRARRMPSVSVRAVPSGATSMSLPVKSVSGADEDVHRTSSTYPVTSSGSVIGSLV